jgi:hypothetical protein
MRTSPPADSNRGRRKKIALLAAVSLVAGVTGFAYVLGHPGLSGVLQRDVGALPDWRWDQSGDLQFGAAIVGLDAANPGRPISPLIYGVALADPATIRALGATVDRSGGNPASTYNWVDGHAWNAGRDWQFRNGNYGQGGSAIDSGVAATLGAGAVPLLTVPTMGWVARNDDNATRSTGVPATGAAALPGGSGAIAGYDPTANRQVVYVPSAASAPSGQQAPAASAPVVYQDQWIRHLASQFGVGPAGVQLFAMDNEPDLWSSTHTDVHPARMGYDDMLANFVQYATAVKAQAPSALVLGPDVSGWTGYLYSDLDRGRDNFATHQDRRNHGDEDFLPWWLGQVHLRDQASGTRTLDYLDVHYYPQERGVALSKQADPGTRDLRIRSTRSLWDPDYTDESWIGAPVTLIPRLRAWIDRSYPGTRLAVTEYNWGGERDASGAVALAEVLGIFGREGVDLATYWTYPPVDSPAGAAFRLYRNYDGSGGTFGDVSLPVTFSQQGVAAFASRHSDTGEVDVVLANESHSTAATVQLRGTTPDRYQAARYCVPAGTGRIVRQDMPDAGSPVSMPPLTVCLVKLSPNR